jgi:hypothetical protein
MDEQQLLAEIEDILRNTPSLKTIHEYSDENFSWLGRVAAALSSWNLVRGGAFARINIDNIQHPRENMSTEGYRKTLTTLHQARSELRMKTLGPLSVALSQGGVFDYFDEIRKIVEAASNDILFIDPYLDAEFVSRYLPNVKHGVSIRLLTSKEKLKTLVPSVEAYQIQSKQLIEVRKGKDKELHDRFVFVDKISCYQSGASFKDGANKSPTTISQVTDAFEAMHTTYEDKWNNAEKVF